MAAVLIPMRSRQFHLSISFLIADAAEWPLKPNSLEISWRILIGVFFKTSHVTRRDSKEIHFLFQWMKVDLNFENLFNIFIDKNEFQVK